MAKTSKRRSKAQPQARRRPAVPVPGGGERFELAMRAINEGVYDWDVANGTIYYSEAVYSVLHMPRSVKTPGGWRKRIHPDDLAAYDAAIVAHFKRKTRRFECDYRYQARDRTWRWARQHGIAMRDKHGRVTRVIGSTGDITELKRVELALAESRERYALATSAATEGIYDWNLESGALYLSDRSKAFFAIKGDALTPATWNKRVHREDFPGYREAIVGYFKGRTRTFEHEYRIRNAAGGYSWVVDRAVAVRNKAGQAIRLVGALSDITQHKLHEIELGRARDEATEALERQTATAGILKVIATSPADVQPVLDAIAESAMRLMGGFSCAVVRLLDGAIHLAALTSTSPSGNAAVKAQFPQSLALADGNVARAIKTKAPVVISDAATDRSVTPAFRKVARARGFRSVVAVPMLREGAAIGALSVSRREPGPFTGPQVDLLGTFASQAAIAIENVRLFNETREALDRQTATSEVMGAISGSLSNTQPVFDRILESCERLFAGRMVGINLLGADGFLHLGAYRGKGRERFEKIFPLPADEGSGSGAAIVRCRVIHYSDVEADPSVPPPTREGCRALGIKSVIFAPMLSEEGAIGAIFVGRRYAVPFTDKEIELLKSFANQAAIGIKNVNLFNETREALERQTATAEILKVIAASPSDVQPVFDAIVASVARLFGRKAALRTVEAEGLRRRARSYEASDGEFHGPEIEPIDRSSIVGRAVLEGRALQWIDTLVDGAAAYGMERARRLAFRSIASAPLMLKGRAIGVISVSSPAPGGLSDKQMTLLETFADQAVIAIENVRLFNETKEALERQTATAEILGAMSGSMQDAGPVFSAIVRSCLSLFPKSGVALRLLRDGVLHVQANEGLDAGPVPVDAGSGVGACVLQARTIHIPDLEAESVNFPRFRRLGLRLGYRCGIFAPLLRDGAAIGTITVLRPEARAFVDKDVALLETFASQAVIAIENVRLFNETREALERQTATSEVLQVISSSPTDTQPVFDAVVRSGMALFSGAGVGIGTVEGGEVVIQAAVGMGGVGKGFRMPLSRESASGMAILERKVVNILDTEEPGAPPYARENGRRLNIRSMTQAPMFREGEPIGSIGVMLRDPGGLDDKQIALLKTFADQAVIAIENVRLFKELQARTEALTKSVGQLTALGEVGQAISSTLDLETVLQTIVHRAVQLTSLDGGSVYEYDEHKEEFRLQAADNQEPELLEAIRRTPIRKGDGTVGNTAVTLEAAQVPDILDAGYQSSRKEILIRAGYRAILTVPLLREDRVIGALSVTRKTPGPFTPEVVELLKTFATQSAMAIQNARLFREIADKGKQLEIASRHKSDFLANMSHELRTPLNAIIGFSEVLIERMFGELNEKQADYMKDIHESGRHLLSLINDILDLSKIEAGRMDLDIAAFDLPSSLANAMTLVRERAQRNGIELGLEVDPALGEFLADERKIKQILLNLLSNAVKFTPQGGRVEVTATRQGDAVQIAVKDSGIGIAPEDHAAVFEEFKQVGSDYTRKAEGTGLGLALTKRFVELHGGGIRLESMPGKGSTFTFTLPVRT